MNDYFWSTGLHAPGPAFIADTSNDKENLTRLSDSIIEKYGVVKIDIHEILDAIEHNMPCTD